MKMSCIRGFLLIAAIVAVAASQGERDMYSVTITTQPRQGPFRMGQRVQFSCSVYPTPPGDLTYRWRTVDRDYGSTYTQQHFNRTYSIYDNNLHFCYYYCEVLANGTFMVGSTSRIVEVQGFLFSEEPVVQSFSRGGSLLLRVNISDSYNARYISSLAWYHNGTRITSGLKYRISSSSNTILSIFNLSESDAGKYEAKIYSLYGSHYPNCIALLESTLSYSPVVFTIQENSVPVYNPHSTITYLYLSNEDPDWLQLKTEQLLPPTLARTYYSIYRMWYRNGVRLSDGNMFNLTSNSRQEMSLQITYNNSADIAGDYVGIASIDYFDLLYNIIPDHCQPYRDLRYDNIILRLGDIPFKISLWTIKMAVPPSSVLVSFDEAILSEWGTTGVECTAVGGIPAEGYNHLMLWGYEGQLLASVNGSHLHYQTTPHQYGTYTCSVGNITNSSTLQERDSFQLLLESTGLQCQQEANNLKSVLSELFDGLCEMCDVYPSNIVDVQLKCSVSGLVYLSAGLVYSSPDGRITASRLTTRLQIWLLSQDNPSVVMDGVTVSVSKQCIPQLNDVTTNACIQHLTAMETETTTTENADSAESSSPTISVIGGFLGGLAAGVLITTLLCILTICVKRLRGSATQTPKSEVPCDANRLEIPMASNRAYESVGLHHQAGGGGGGMRSGQQQPEQLYESMDTRYQVGGATLYQASGEEAIYEHPTV